MSLNFLFKNGYEPCRKVLISELNQRRTSTGSGLFSFVNSGFTQIFGKTLRNLSIECLFKTAFYTYLTMLWNLRWTQITSRKKWGFSIFPPPFIIESNLHFVLVQSSYVIKEVKEVIISTYYLPPSPQKNLYWIIPSSFKKPLPSHLSLISHMLFFSYCR